jgi:Asp-tRNA(Asn)/Glu-tRNA(Gln) amidotransferase A subunit family amidase
VSATTSFRDGTASPRAFLEDCLSAVDAHEGDVRAFVHLDIASARAAADEASRRWKSGRPLSPIDGLPLGVKDVIETAGMPTEMGSPLFKGWRGWGDSASVAALRAAGVVILGKTVTTEFAATVPGPTANPLDLTRTPGGSSSGSAAGVAAGFITAGLGTQVVGSILRPAAYCGVVGYKPTIGAINRGGSHDYLSQSCQGVIASTLQDTWAVAYAAAQAGGDPGHPGLFGPAAAPAARTPSALAVIETTGWSKATAAAKAKLAGARDRLTVAGIAVEDRRSSSLIAEVEDAIADAMTLTRTINAFESLWPLRAYRDTDASKLSAILLARLAEAEALPIATYREALEARAAARASFARLAGSFDTAITLTAPDVAPLGLASTGDAVFVVPGSLLGVPALSLPSFAIDRLPLGLQLLGFAHRDSELFAVAAGIESVLGRETVGPEGSSS